MIKLIFTGILLYYLYRLVIKSPLLDQYRGKEADKISLEKDPPHNPEADGDYIDYEEVE